MEHCREKTLCRSIGVMNCPVVMFLEILTFCNRKPALNCLEMHPYFTNLEAQRFYKKLDVPLAAYAPLCPSENLKFAQSDKVKNLNLLQDSLIKELAKKYKKTEAQIILNWHMRMNHILFPGMRQKEHFEQNADIFEFELNEEEVHKIN
jgi:diketogulonate reductase-like aldo/keto reductase